MRRMQVLGLILLSVVLGVLGQISLKLGMREVGEIELKDLASKKIFKLIFQKFVVAGIFMYGVATIFWLVVLSKEEVSFAYPLIGIGYILVAIFGKILFNENLTLLRMIGIVLIAIGAYLIVSRV